MLSRILRRLGWAAVILWGTTVITFLIVHAVPADPVRVYAGANADAETIERIRAEMGFDDPLIVQYGRYIGNLARGDLGTSLVTGERVLDALMARFPVTLSLALTAVCLWMLMSVPLGVLTAKYRG
ncbi:MAG: ABC transporter permease, partial [bacterium]|nr:ABC transporter permease [bacterium]